MPRTRSLITAAATAAVTLSAAAPALARTDTVGNASGEAHDNICLLDFKCTYMNTKAGKPTDVVKHTGTLKSWKVSASSVGGTVRLRVLRPAGHGAYRFVRSSSLRTVSDLGVNTFPTTLKVKKGDVLAMTNTTSGIYMAPASTTRSVRYFDYTTNQADGAKSKPNQTRPALRLLLSGVVKR